MTALKAIGFYILATIGFFIFWLWFFDKPNEHEILIPVLTAFFSSASAEKILEDEREETSSYLIVAVVTSGFWLYLFLRRLQRYCRN